MQSYQTLQKILNATESTSSDSGAVTVNGGIGVIKNVCVGGNVITNGIMIQSTDDSTSTSTGSLVISGGIGVGKRIFIGGDVSCVSGTNSTSFSTGSLKVTGGVGVNGNVFVTGTSTDGILHLDRGGGYPQLTLTNNSSRMYIGANNSGDTSTSVGSGIYVEGGTSTTKSKLYLGSTISGGNPTTGRNDVEVLSTTESSSSSTGAMCVSGGVGIGKALNLGSKLIFSNILEKKRITLYDTNNNNFQYYGFGLLSNEIRYQVSSTGGHHSFYSGVNSTMEQVLVKIEGDYGHSQGVLIYHTTQSSNAGTGSLVIHGGLGIAKDTFTSGNVNILSTILSTSSSSGALIVGGGVGIKNDECIGGSVSLTSATSKISFTADNTKKRCALYDIGNDYQWYGFGMQLSELRIQIASTASRCSYVVGTSSTTEEEILRINGDTNAQSGVNIMHTSESSGTSTGALVVSGGVGVGDSLYHSGLYPTHVNGVYIEGTYGNIKFKSGASAMSNWNLSSSGGVEIFNIYNTGTNVGLYVGHPIESSGTTTGSIVIGGGAGIAKKLNVGGDTKIMPTTSSTSSSSGALVVSGGIGCYDMYVDVVAMSAYWGTVFYSGQPQQNIYITKVGHLITLSAPNYSDVKPLSPSGYPQYTQVLAAKYRPSSKHYFQLHYNLAGLFTVGCIMIDTDGSLYIANEGSGTILAGDFFVYSWSVTYYV